MGPLLRVAKVPTIPLSLPGRQISCFLEVFPGLSGLGQGEQEEKGT